MSQWSDIRARFFANKLAVVGLVILVVLVIVAIFAPLLAPFDPLKQDLTNTLQAPGGDHLLGTDSLGRDQLSRLIYGSRIAMIVGMASILVACTIGIVLGALAGYFGRLVDSVIMRVADVFFAFPLLIGAIVVILLMGRGGPARRPVAGHLLLGHLRPPAAQPDPLGARDGLRARRPRWARASSVRSGGTSCPTRSPLFWSTRPATSASHRG
ncbi:hypothetical protein GTV15_18935 [Streptomyces sp. SID7803]|nr:hypothetical protein [Streptomyces sp. SID7803]